MALLVVGWAVAKGYTAEQRADQVDTRLQVHAAAQDARLDAIAATLVRIDATQQRMFNALVGE